MLWINQESTDDAAAAVTEEASTDTAAGSAGDMFAGITVEDLMQYGVAVAKAIVLIILVLIISKWIRNLILKITRKANVDETLARFFANMGKYAIMLLGGLAILGMFGVDTTSFAAVIAAMGFAVGMAMSGLLGNFAAGIMLLIFRPFKIGDVVSAGGVTGKVEAIELSSRPSSTPRTTAGSSSRTVRSTAAPSRTSPTTTLAGSMSRSVPTTAPTSTRPARFSRRQLLLARA